MSQNKSKRIKTVKTSQTESNKSNRVKGVETSQTESKRNESNRVKNGQMCTIGTI